MKDGKETWPFVTILCQDIIGSRSKAGKENEFIAIFGKSKENRTIVLNVLLSAGLRAKKVTHKLQSVIQGEQHFSKSIFSLHLIYLIFATLQIL